MSVRSLSVIVAFFLIVGFISARPLQWFSDKTIEDVTDSSLQNTLSSVVEKDWEFPKSRPHLHEMVAPTSFLQTSTGGHPLECDCERVKCNCVKRCECGLPASTENKQAANFLQLAAATGKKTAPLWVDIDSNECFLQTGESVGQDTHHMLDCECDKVKCNCVKHCECSLPASASGSTTGGASNNLLQLDQGVELKKSDKKEVEEVKSEQPESENKKIEEEETVQAETPKVAPRIRGRARAAAKVEKATAAAAPENEKAEYSNYEYSQKSGEKSAPYSYSEEYSS